MGKPIGSDLREGKVTLPLIHMLRHASDGRAGEIVRDVHRVARRDAPKQWQELLAYLQAARVDRLRVPPRGRVRRAREEPLSTPSPPSSERDALLALPDYVLARDR